MSVGRAGRDDDGLTLVEFVIAMFLVVVVLLAGLAGVTSSLRSVATNTASTGATQLVSEVHEELAALPWNSLGLRATDPGYVAGFEGFPTAELPATSASDPAVPVPLRTVVRGSTTYTVRVHVVKVPEGTDAQAYRRVSVIVSWTPAGGAERSVHADRTRSATTAEEGMETFLVRSLDAVLRNDSTLAETFDPFPLSSTWTVRSGSSLVVRATTNLSAAGVTLSYPALSDPSTGATTTRTAAMSLVGGDDRSWQVVLPAGEQFKPGISTFAVTATSAWNSAVQASLQTPVESVEPAARYWTRTAVGTSFACRVDTLGRAWCWGGNSAGQLGNGTTTDSAVPVRVGSLTEVVSINTGVQHACAVTRPGALYCWGNSGHGRLGVPVSATKCGGASCEPSPVLVPLSQVAVVSAGRTHTCATTTGGALYCWGETANGKLGIGAVSSTNVASPQLVSAVTGARTVAASIDHTCAVDADTRVWCWGSGAGARLNGAATTDSPTLISVTGAVTINTTSGQGSSDGQATTCITATDGRIGCWGTNAYGQAGGAASTSTTLRWTAITGMTASYVAPAVQHTCALLLNTSTERREQRCWGGNGSAQLGDGTYSPTAGAPPTAAAFPTGTKPPAAIGAGETETCAITTDDATWCWGRAGSGALGQGSATDRSTPGRVTNT